MVGAGGRWYCDRCGRLLATVAAGPGAASSLVIICKRCKQVNRLDMRLLGERREQCPGGGLAGQNAGGKRKCFKPEQVSQPNNKGGIVQ